MAMEGMNDGEPPTPPTSLHWASSSSGRRHPQVWSQESPLPCSPGHSPGPKSNPKGRESPSPALTLRARGWGLLRETATLGLAHFIQRRPAIPASHAGTLSVGLPVRKVPRVQKVFWEAPLALPREEAVCHLVCLTWQLGPTTSGFLPALPGLWMCPTFLVL